ncbi:hypothetical protein ACIPSA_41400 [Streptomyces sp. NPDC086549]|uniref:hypothetical protein n=1 Tax=Streptomyces sp. NPDC086549 TaxID=3365752 RepID=UPI0037FEA74B
MTHSPIPHPDTVTVPSAPCPVRPREDALDRNEARLPAGLASATSLAGAASATWIAVRAFARHRTVPNRRATTAG